MIRDRNFYKTIFRISLPAAFSALVSFLVVVADDIMVSYIGSGVNQQSAVSQINAITAFYTATISGLVSGSSVLIAQYWGKKDMERIKRIFSMVFMLSFGVSLLFCLAAVLFPDTIIRLILKGDGGDVTQLARDYFLIACFSYIPFAVTNALTGMLRSVEVVRVTLYVSIASLFANIILNYIFIFGRLGLPAMGVQGAALATLLTRLIEMTIVWIYTFRIQKVLDIKPKNLVSFDRVLFKDYAKYGLPVCFTDMQWALVGLLKAAIIGQMATSFISANAITNAMMNLGTMFTFALAGGACVVVGKAVGKGDIETAKEYSKTIQIMFAIIAFVMAAIVFLLRKPFTSLYNSAEDPEVYRLSILMIAIGAVTIIGTSYHASCFVGINRGAGDSRFVAKVDMICGWLIVLPCMFLSAVVFHLPGPIVFLASRIDQCFKWIIAFFRLRGDKWIKNVTRND